MNMYVHATYNLYIFMYMFIACTYMFKIIGNLVNMYRHVCTMFSDVRTVLPILVQVVRIPDAGPASLSRCHGHWAVGGASHGDSDSGGIRFTGKQ